MSGGDNLTTCETDADLINLLDFTNNEYYENVNCLGNIVIKHKDKWRGDYYLKENLTFTTNRKEAGNFYILKSGNTSILNGDRITINSGNKTITIDKDNQIKLIDREQVLNNINSFIISNGSDNIEPISYESPIYFISDKNNKTGLKYEWALDIITENIPIKESYPINYKPRPCPTLLNSNYSSTCESYIHTYQFYLEKFETTQSQLSHITYNSNNNVKSKSLTDFFEKYKSALMIISLMVILVLCILISQ